MLDVPSHYLNLWKGYFFWNSILKNRMLQKWNKWPQSGWLNGLPMAIKRQFAYITSAGMQPRVALASAVIQVIDNELHSFISTLSGLNNPPRLAGGGKNWFLPLVLTGLNWLAETPSAKNWQKLKWPKLFVFWLAIAWNVQMFSECYWDLLCTLPHWFHGWLLLKCVWVIVIMIGICFSVCKVACIFITEQTNMMLILKQKTQQIRVNVFRR